MDTIIRMQKRSTENIQKAHGATEVLNALFLAAFGGKEMARVMEMSWEANQIARELEGEDEDP